MTDYAIIERGDREYEVWQLCGEVHGCCNVFHTLLATTDQPWKARQIVEALTRPDTEGEQHG